MAGRSVLPSNHPVQLLPRLLIRERTRRVLSRVRTGADAALVLVVIIAALVGVPRLLSGVRRGLFGPDVAAVESHLAFLAAALFLIVTVSGWRQTLAARRVAPWVNPWLVLGGDGRALRRRELVRVAAAATGWWLAAVWVAWPLHVVVRGGGSMLALVLLGGTASGYACWMVMSHLTAQAIPPARRVARGARTAAAGSSS